MANGIRINNLNQATSLNDTDTITIIQDNENKKASISLFDKDGTYTQSVVNTIPDLITTSKANVETTKQAIDEKFGDDKFSTQIITSQEMSSVGVSDDGSVDVSSQVRDGFMESAILKGNTLVNLINVKNATGGIAYTTKDLNLAYELPVGKYILFYDIIKANTSSGLEKPDRHTPTVTFNDGTKIYQGFEGFNTSNGKKYWIINATTPIVKVEYWLANLVEDGEVDNLRLFAYQDGMENWDIPYFTGMQSVKMPVLTTSNQRFTILPYEIFENSIASNYQGFTRIDFGLTLTDVMCYIKLNNDMKIKMIIDGFEEVNTNSGISKGVEYSKKLNNISYIGLYNWGDIQMGGGKETILSMLKNGELEIVFSKDGEKKYPHYSNNTKSNILTVNEPIELRGIGDVQDTLDSMTGEMTERIGEIVLDDTLSYEHAWRGGNDTETDYVIGVKVNNHLWNVHHEEGGSLIKCDKLRTRGITSFNSYGFFLFYVSKSVLGEELTNAKIREYILSLNATVQYPLATESVKTVDLNSSNGDAKTPIVYKNGHILLQSDGLIPELHYSIPVSYNGLIAQNTMTNLKHSWRLDELEIMAYTSIVNSQYESLILVATAETNEVVVSSDYVQDESLYNMLKVLVNASALENADEKINVFYLYGKLSDEMYIDLIMGDDM